MDPQTPKSHRRRRSSMSSGQPSSQPNTPERRSTVKKWKEGIPVFETGQHPESSLPFSFGVEFELQLRVKNGTGLDIGNYPAAEASFSVMRRYNFSLLESIAEILTQEGMDAVRHDMSSDDPLDYSKWNVVLDGSLSKAHMKDGYYPVEIVTPVILGDDQWASKIDKFWAVLLSKFQVLLDTTSVCPDKYRAWNLLPAREGKAGSIEFRRPPGVSTAKKAKHWIAFTMSFIYLAIRANPSHLSSRVDESIDLDAILHPDFLEDLLRCARQLDVFAHLDPRLIQVDDVSRLHITMAQPESVAWLRSLNLGYNLENFR
ncbi:hypothetical protein N5P37_010123 [Trichoderma harzianum]|nr:hypothetical protein N5P37_010123 [Trichoderma harzianum]